MKKWNRIYGVLALLLALALVAGIVGVTLSQGRQIPENPNTKEPEPLRTETPAGISGDSLREEEEKDEPEEDELPPPDAQEETQPQPEEPREEQNRQPSQNEASGQTGAPKPEESGKPGQTGEGGDPSQEPGSGEEEGAEPGLVTNLYSGMIVKISELENNQLPFYVYYSDPAVEANIVVKMSHKSAPTRYTTLRADGVNYTADLQLGTNYIVVVYSDAEGNRPSARFAVSLVADKADREHPTVGEGPPTIETNLDSWEGMIKQQEFTFTVKARTWQGAVVYSNHLTVTMDGKVITAPTGSGTYEYVLFFQRPNVGDVGHHLITVTAWDDEGNSRFVQYEVDYYAQDEGAVIGSVTIVIDATTVGLGIVDEGEYDIIQGQPAAATVLAMLEEYGYEYSAGGSVKVGFYLRSLSRGDAFLGAEIPAELDACITRDGIDRTSPCTRDTLSEYDFTMGSGWMYCINGALFPGKGLSDYYLNDGDVITLRFTLAYGKDVGGYTSAGGSYGRYAGYCGMWVDGGFTELGHSWDTEHPVRVEPAEGAAGYIEYTCSLCGETRREELPPAGPEPGESGGTEPGESGGTEPGESGGTEPGESGGTEPGESGGTEPGESGGTEPGESGGTEPGESGGTEPGESGRTEPGESGGTEPGESGGTEPSESGGTEPGESGGTEPSEPGESNAGAA